MKNCFHLFVLTILFSYSSKAQTTNNEPFIVVREKQTTQKVLKSFLASGEGYLISSIPDGVKVEVILPYIYLFDQINKKLNVVDRKGNFVLKNIPSIGFSANENGILILNEKKQLRIFTIKDNSVVECPESLNNIAKFKISDRVILTSKENVGTIETYQLNLNRNSFYPISTPGWSNQANIVSIAYNGNFIVAQDWQQLVQVTNVQGISINTGRGALKNFYMTKNHFIAHYGSGKVEVFNAYEKQYVLSLPQVFVVKTSGSFSSFKWDVNEVTIVNEKGEIFSLAMNSESKFSHGEDNYALSNGNNIKIFNNSGVEQFTQNFDQLVGHSFVGDFLCVNQRNMLKQTCFNAKVKNGASYSIKWDSDALQVALPKWGFYQFNNETLLLQFYLNNGKQQMQTSIEQVYIPLTIQKNDHNLLIF